MGFFSDLFGTTPDAPEFNSQTRKSKFKLDNGEYIDTLEFYVEGRIDNSFNRDVKLICTYWIDITADNNTPVLTNSERHSLDGLPFVCVDCPSSDGTYFRDFVKIGNEAIISLRFPYKGRRRIQFSYAVVDKNVRIQQVTDVSENALHFHTSFLDIDVKELGWKEKVENMDRIVELSIDLCLFMAASDGNLDQDELNQIKEWVRSNYIYVEDVNDRDELKKRFSNHLKTSYKKVTNKEINYTSVIDEFIKKSDTTDHIALIELLFRVIGADGVFSKEEDIMINSLREKLKVPQDTFNQIKNKAIINIDKLEMSDNSNEQLFGISANMSSEEKCKVLRKQYSKWNGQTTSSDENKRKKAKEMIDIIIDLRKKYKCQ